MENRVKHLLFLVNEKSGTETGPPWKDVLADFFDPNEHSFEIFNLPDKINLEKLKQQVLSIKAEAVIAVGGDGTVSLAANILAGKETILGIIPQGSANGMAAELNIPEDVNLALQIIKDGYSRPCDLIEIKNYCYCLHMADAGLNAHLIKHFDESKKRGMLGYALVIFKTLWRKRKLNVSFTVGGEKLEREAFMVCLANASKYGTGAVINPEGKLDDGLFEIVVVRHLNVAALMKMLFKPGLFNPEKIEIFKVSEVQITGRHAMYFQIDGEYKGRVKKVEAKAFKDALTIFVKRPGN